MLALNQDPVVPAVPAQRAFEPGIVPATLLADFHRLTGSTAAAWLWLARLASAGEHFRVE
jgi:hypothetical protein